ncbi:MAG: hypothetical protein WKF30_13320 [Pyrinomonadaceae bacterium]
MHQIKSATDIAEAQRVLAARFAAYPEWLCAEGDVELRSVALRAGEWAFEVAVGRLILSYWGDRGARRWVITGWDFAGPQILLAATRRMGTDQALLKFTPRLSVRQEVAALAAARAGALTRFVEIVRARFPDFFVERANLTPGAHPGVPGRYARLLLSQTKSKTRVAVTGEVNAELVRDNSAFLSSALLWYERMGELSRPASKLLLIAADGDAEEMNRLISLLRPRLRASIEMYESDRATGGPLTFVARFERAELCAQKASVRWRGRCIAPGFGELTERIIALAPEAVDVVHARHGETLRFHGLAFARVRRTMGGERAWFGIDHQKRQPFGAESWPALVELVEQLRLYRSAGAADRHHAFYRAAPEAWLESILRRDITRLDPGMISSPLYAQFRASRVARAKAARHIDLFALRHDGRLVLVELKVTDDRGMPLHAADDWLRVEAMRRQGTLARAELSVRRPTWLTSHRCLPAAPMLSYRSSDRLSP